MLLNLCLSLSLSFFGITARHLGQKSAKKCGGALGQKEPTSSSCISSEENRIYESIQHCTQLKSKPVLKGAGISPEICLDNLNVNSNLCQEGCFSIWLSIKTAQNIFIFLPIWI
jgi:hypothetical protein